LLISQTEIHFEWTTISHDSRDYGKFAVGATSDPEKAYQDCFQKWQRRWEQYINARGEYFEDDKARSIAGVFKKGSAGVFKTFIKK
jgi:broad specificity phosphatase PhoE